MDRLTFEESKTLARVFGEPTTQKTIVLWLFREPGKKYDVIKEKMKSIPKPYRVPDASLYRQVDKLAKSHFLDIIKKGSMTLRKPVDINEYQLSFPKGILALAIYAYVLYLSPDTSDTLKKKLELAGLAEMVELPFWRPFLFFLEWHRDTGIDLSRAKIEPLYYSFTFFLAMLGRLEEITEKDFDTLADMMQLLGLGPQQGGRITLEELRNLKSRFQQTHEKMRAMVRSPTSSEAKALLQKLKSMK